MWQAANPNAWMSAKDDDEKLLPFRYGYGDVTDRDDGFWTSKRCRSLLPLGYTYPDIPFIYNKKTLQERVDELYYDSPARPRAPSGSEKPPPALAWADSEKPPPALAWAGSEKPPPALAWANSMKAPPGAWAGSVKPPPALAWAASGFENPALDIAEYLVIAKYET